MRYEKGGNADDGGRHRALFASVKTAIRLINEEAMKERAFDFVYGRDIRRDEWRPLMWLAAYEAKYRKHPGSTELVDLVMEANDVAEPKARMTVNRAQDLGMIRSERDGTARYFFLPFADEHGSTKLSRLEDLLDIIRKVIDIQLADPTNETAGSEHLPPEVYYNIVRMINERKKV